MIDRPQNRWTTLEEAAQEVHAPITLIEQWAKEGRIATRREPVTQACLVLFDEVEDMAEEAAFRLLSRKALAREDQD